jgi:hypothetical protein
MRFHRIGYVVVVLAVAACRNAAVASPTIADNGSGDLLVLPPNDDRVHWYDHETGDLSPVDVDWGFK